MRDIDSGNAMKQSDVAKLQGQSASSVIKQLAADKAKNKAGGVSGASKKRE